MLSGKHSNRDNCTRCYQVNTATRTTAVKFRLDWCSIRGSFNSQSATGYSSAEERLLCTQKHIPKLRVNRFSSSDMGHQQSSADSYPLTLTVTRAKPIKNSCTSNICEALLRNMLLWKNWNKSSWKRPGKGRLLTYNDDEGGGGRHVLELNHGHKQGHVVVLGTNEKQPETHNLHRLFPPW